ncbi:MAG: ribosome-associated translation inhibitor RaiA [Rikenellaceae bacterium]
MNVKIQSLKFDADKKLTDFIENKMTKLERFSDKITSSEVTLKLDKDIENGNKVVTISLLLPGDTLVAENQCKTFEEAVDISIDALKKQLEKYKTKH